MKTLAIGLIAVVVAIFIYAGATYPYTDAKPLLDVLKDWQPTFAAIGVVVAAFFAYSAATAKVKSEERERNREREATFAKQLARLRASCWRIHNEVEPIIKILDLPERQGRDRFDFVAKVVSKVMETHQGLAELHLDLAHLLPTEIQVEATKLAVHYQAVRDSMKSYSDDIRQHPIVEQTFFSNLTANAGEVLKYSALIQKACAEAQEKLRASHDGR